MYIMQPFIRGFQHYIVFVCFCKTEQLNFHLLHLLPSSPTFFSLFFSLCFALIVGSTSYKKYKSEIKFTSIFVYWIQWTRSSVYFHTEIKIKTYVCHNSLHVVLFYNLVYIHRWQYHIYHLDSRLDYSPTYSYH